MIKPWNEKKVAMITAMQAEIDELRAENAALLAANRDSMDHYNELRAELEKIKQQEPVGHLAMDGYFIQNQRYVMENGKVPRAMPLYLAPGAQPVPENCGSSHCSCIECHKKGCK